MTEPPPPPQAAGPPAALIVVDVQNDFCEGGSMGVDGGAAVAASITELVQGHRHRYAAVIATRDWHVDPGEHWAAEGAEPDFDVSWPRHCEAGTTGAQFHPALQVDFDEVFSKGETSASFSGFEGAAPAGSGLAQWLVEREITAVDVVGIATDHCVRATALDAVEAGFHTRVLIEHCAGVAPVTTAAAQAELVDAGVELA